MGFFKVSVYKFEHDLIRNSFVVCGGFSRFLRERGVCDVLLMRSIFLSKTAPSVVTRLATIPTPSGSLGWR